MKTRSDVQQHEGGVRRLNRAESETPAETEQNTPSHKNRMYAQISSYSESQHEVLRAYASGQSRTHAILTASRPGAGIAEYISTEREIRALTEGVGPELAPFLTDTAVTDLLVVGGKIWIDRGDGLHDCNAELGSEYAVRALAVRMAAACGRRLDDACPVVDGTLPNGMRLHAVLPPVSAGGTTISIRAFGAVPLSLDDMEKSGSVHPEVADLLRKLVHVRANVVISGATGSGKSTLLGALLSLVPHNQRIVCIEEVSELRPQHPHVVSLQERRANIQGTGEVTLSDLVRAAMRMRPDRIVLGECRGPEVRDVLTALNTGHSGGWVTLHANAVEDVPARLSALGALAHMSMRAISAQVNAGLDAVIHMQRHTGESPKNLASVRAQSPGPRRWVSQIGVFRAGHEATMQCVPALEIRAHGQIYHREGWEELRTRIKNLTHM
ncbi:MULTISPECIES: TadA family conjugal transfer-associated ATPase [unclassified Schaalia]|uniref:TadA family conjugal transfer-associated ATPase n=1 Tax=unclassified Schaalia TaxID=2691889 RepID=UPI001E3210B4|nr:MULTISPECIES: TadA family conjugal transfer-associated ATPase [unclassified Schaalia]MCD4548834.1 TadA family conjugal transfer-associated ATPase [Schaalia sp. lx-260]MCD4557450.1 TadA family conjugal transfer-associated ATPase [Schaalia sp. lx-100]